MERLVLQHIDGDLTTELSIWSFKVTERLINYQNSCVLMLLYNVVPLFLVLPRCAIGDNQYDISKWITHKRDCNLNYCTGICMPKNALINVGLLLRLKKTTRATIICMLQIWLHTITHQSNWFNESNAIYFACCCLITPHISMFQYMQSIVYWKVLK